MPYPTSPDGFVYFIQAIGGGPIKIGWAKDPAKRLVLLQCGNPVELRICRTHPGTIQDERGLHRIFGEVHLRGEWFHAHPALARVADAIVDPDIEDSVLKPALELSWDVRFRMQCHDLWQEQDSLAYCPQRYPDDVREQRLAEQHRRTGDVYLAARGDMITVLPEDMARPEDWQQSSAHGRLAA